LKCGLFRVGWWHLTGGNTINDSRPGVILAYTTLRHRIGHECFKVKACLCIFTLMAVDACRLKQGTSRGGELVPSCMASGWQAGAEDAQQQPATTPQPTTTLPPDRPKPFKGIW
jgi:uncharacterized membrane protein YsdA (DUF1294 family)